MSGGESESADCARRCPAGYGVAFVLSRAKARVDKRKAAASEILRMGKLRGGQKIQDAISKFLEELGNLLNELNNAV